MVSWIRLVVRHNFMRLCEETIVHICDRGVCKEARPDRTEQPVEKVRLEKYFYTHTSA